MSSYYNKSFFTKKEETDVEALPKITRGKEMDSLLFDLLTTVSPYGKESLISDIILKAINKGKKHKKKVISRLDVKGNLIVQVGDYKKSKVMFSSHMDTVQTNLPVSETDLRLTEDGFVYASYDTEVSEYLDHSKNKVTQDDIEDFAEASGHKYQNYILLGKGKAKTLHGSDSKFDGWVSTGLTVKPVTTLKPVPSVLGADDKLGCYIMCKLIENATEGLYIFHIGEECGGVGSSYIATSTPEVVEGMNYCIAFDRYSYGHIITHQSGGRCCSDDFVESLAAKLNPLLPPKEQMAGNSGGSFTDSANYIKLIPECTNVSVSYKSQHTTNENFDLTWFTKMLVPALLKITWYDLAVDRDPNEVSTPYSSRYGSQSSFFKNAYGSNSDTGSVVSARCSSSSTYTNRLRQSSVDKMNHILSNKFEGYDPEDGFPNNLSITQKVDLVKYTFLKNDMSMSDIAEMVVDAEIEADKRLLETDRVSTLNDTQFDDPYRRYGYDF